MTGEELRGQPSLASFQPQMVHDSLDDVAAMQRLLRPASKSAPSSPGSTWQMRKAAQRAALEAQAQQREAAFRAAMHARQAREAEQREANFQTLYREVLEGMQLDTGILAEVQEVLDQADQAHHARQAELYQQWSSQVFDRIQERIHDSLATTSSRHAEAAPRTPVSPCHHSLSSKLSMALDEGPADRHNPMIRVHTADLVDPLKKDLLMTQAEKSVLQTCRGKCSSADSRLSNTQLERAALRPTLDVRHWAAGQIHATPHGHCIDDATANYVIKVASPADLAQKSSHVYLDDYNTPAPEYYKPSKHMAAPATQGGRSSFFDLMQGRNVSSSDSRAGDSWLEHKGKRRVNSPTNAHARPLF